MPTFERLICITIYCFVILFSGAMFFEAFKHLQNTGSTIVVKQEPIECGKSACGPGYSEIMLMVNKNGRAY